MWLRLTRKAGASLIQALQRLENASVRDVGRLQVKVTAAVLVLCAALMPAANHWHLWRFWVNRSLTHQLLADVLQERVLLGPQADNTALQTKNVYVRCFIPAGADPVDMKASLSVEAITETQGWVQGSTNRDSWWVLDVSRGEISTLSRMDETVLRPHRRMNRAQCFPTNTMRFINAGLNERGQREFQVLGPAATTTTRSPEVLQTQTH